jgi:hypothetical protein
VENAELVLTLSHAQQVRNALLEVVEIRLLLHHAEY